MNEQQAINELKALQDYVLNDAPTVIGVLAREHFKENFNKGGFDNDKWAARKMRRPGGTNGQTPLNQSGNLKDSIDYKITGTSVTIYTDSIYAQIHNEGGTITVTSKMRKYFWAMHYDHKEAGNLDIAEGFKYCALAKAITIEKRQFIGDSEALNAAIEEKITKDFNRILNNQ